MSENLSLQPEFGIIGGSGLCSFPELRTLKKVVVETPFGMPSDLITIGTIEAANKEQQIVAFLPRHGEGHTIPPHKVPYKANIDALIKLGVKQIFATCIAGSLKTKICPGDLVIPDQFVNLTWGRDDYFDIDKHLIHLPMAEPYCSNLREILYECAQALGFRVHKEGTVVVIQGPRFSTRAESEWFSRQSWDIINMTQYPECYFAREQGLCYAVLAFITDYDVGLKEDVTISVEGMKKVLEIFRVGIERQKVLLRSAVHQKWDIPKCYCSTVNFNEYYKGLDL